MGEGGFSATAVDVLAGRHQERGRVVRPEPNLLQRAWRDVGHDHIELCRQALRLILTLRDTLRDGSERKFNRIRRIREAREIGSQAREIRSQARAARGLAFSVDAVAIEGTGSHGAGLASFVRRNALRVVEVSHGDRRKRRTAGKTDTIDAECAARAALAGTATAIPKSADGAAEMVRQIKIARDTAVKAKSAAIIALKTLLVNAPSELRETLEPLTDRALVMRCSRLIPGPLADVTAAVKHAIRALAARWRVLADEIETHDTALDLLTAAAVPTLRAAFGIGPNAAAEMLIVAGDNPARIRSEAAFAKLVGVCPIPASRGMNTRHRLFRGGHRQANAAL